MGVCVDAGAGAAAVGALSVCLPDLSCLPAAAPAHLHFKLRLCIWAAGGYPGTWVHLSSYLHNRPN